MTEQRDVRADLERLFAASFSDYQWGLIAAQGYENAILSGARTVEEVAQELRSLIEAAGAGRAEGPGATAAGRPGLTWDEMERLVLGRILANRETNGPRLVLGQPRGGGERTKRLSVSRERSRRSWLIALGSVLGVLVVALVAVLVFGGLQCGSNDQGSTVTVTSDGARTGIEAVVLPFGPSSTTTTELPPETVPQLRLPDYTAELVGTEVVPAVRSEATGILELTLSEDGQTVSYILSLESLEGLTLARLRVGEPGVNGDEILTLYAGPTKEGAFTGVAAQGSFGAAEMVGPLEGKTMAEFIALLEQGSVYVIVGSTENKGGELRGQLK